MSDLGHDGLYHAYGVSIASTFPLPEFPKQMSNAARIHITGALAKASAPPAPAPIDQPMAVERLPGGIRLQYPGLVDFFLSNDYRAVNVQPVPGAPETTIRHLLVDQALLWALSGQGELILHASSVGSRSGAVLFLGPSGAGKSTIAAALAGRGWSVLCDDGARVVRTGSEFTVVPSYPGLRLWPDGVDAVVPSGSEPELAEVTHSSPKRRWVPESPQSTPTVLRCIFVLTDSPGDVEVGPITQREALVNAFDQSFRIPGGSRSEVRRHFDRTSALVAGCRVLRLCYPYDFSKLGTVVDLVESTLEAQCDSTAPGS